MKKVFILAYTLVFIFFGCTKNDQSTSSRNSTIPLVADAGSDTTICMPYGGSGNLFKTILDGRASHDGSGKIVSYAWSEIGPNPSTVFSTSSSTDIILSGGLHQFMLKVADDHNQMELDTVVINVVQDFNTEYVGLTWDSTVGILKTISVRSKPALIESWPGPYKNIQLDSVYVSDYDGTCKDLSSWKQIPYVPYDSIQLTDKPLFYSVIFDIPNTVNLGTGYPELFAKTSSGIDFNQKVSIGFKNDNPTGAGDWDY